MPVPKKILEPAGPPPAFAHYLIKVKMMGMLPKTFKIGKEFEMSLSETESIHQKH